jgi:hypothetical protein
MLYQLISYIEVYLRYSKLGSVIQTCVAHNPSQCLRHYVTDARINFTHQIVVLFDGKFDEFMTSQDENLTGNLIRNLSKIFL